MARSIFKILLAVFLCVAIIQDMGCHLPRAQFIEQSDICSGNECRMHNYAVFLDKSDREQKRFIELNGWLLLEALLREATGGDLSQNDRHLLARFRDRDGDWGWWPAQIMSTGNTYFRNRPPIFLPPDLDCMMWGHRLFDRSLTVRKLKEYLSDLPLPKRFRTPCKDIHCEKDKILRTWQFKKWHHDVDIIVIANCISGLDEKSVLAQDVFQENKKFINYIIEQYNYHDFFMYYEPKVTGDFLLLFYDHLYRSFLTEKARAKVMQRFKEGIEDLEEKPLMVDWNFGKASYYGYKLKSVNEHISPLMVRYAAENSWKEQESH